ncbi:MAG: M16 family metallopeptidase [Candidatus Entotheonellia bacterium]
MTDRATDGRFNTAVTAVARWLVLCLLMVATLIALTGSGATLAADTMTLHIPSKKVTLPNGLTVVVSAKDKLPIASISVRFKVGSAYDPEEKAGLAEMTSRLLDKGTTQRTATAIAEELDFLGARLDASAGGTGSTVSLSLLGKDIERGLDLFADILQDSRFEMAELERERAQMLSQIQQRQVNPRQVVSEAFREVLYGEHPLHRPIAGYASTVSQITRDDVLAFYQRFYVPNNAIIVMVGDFSEARMIELIERTLGGWQARPVDQITLPQPSPTKGKEVRIVDMEVNQSYVQFGHLSVRRADPEFAAMRAMNYILGGGGFVSRLTRSIREEQGLAYSVHSDFVGGSQFPGFFYIGLQTRIDTTSQALNSLFAVLDRMQQAPVSADELTDMKLYYEGSLPRRAESYGQVAGLLIDREFFGLPDGYWESEIRHIQQLTPEDIQRLAHRYLDTDNFVLALVSKRDQLDLAVTSIPTEAIRYVPAP